MSRLLKGAGAVVGVVVLSAAAFVGWSWTDAQARLAGPYDIQPDEIPVPWPLTDAEIAALQVEAGGDALAEAEAVDADGVVPGGEPAADGTDAEPQAPALSPADLERIAMDRAVARGKHLVTTRGGCHECHGEDLAGGVVMDVPPVMRFIAPNITQGQGSQTIGFTSADYVRILRHGVNRDGSASLMPAIDYTQMSDQELSDIIAYVQSFPPVDNEMEPAGIGPVMAVQMATGAAPISYEHIDHQAARPEAAPEPEPTVAYGAHITQVCVGCHGMGFSGGKIPGGDPAWPAASNLTPHETGLAGWTEADFLAAMREGVRPDGSQIDPGMPWQYTAGMTDVELKAMYAYLQSREPTPFGNR